MFLSPVYSSASLGRKPPFIISFLALEASMAQGYKSDASHCANPDIAGEDVPTSVKNLVTDILKVRIIRTFASGHAVVNSCLCCR